MTGTRAPDGCHDGSRSEADADAFSRRHRTAEESAGRLERAVDAGYEPESGDRW